MQFEYGVFWGCKPYYPLWSLSMTDIKEKALRSSKRLYNSVKERNVIAEETKGQNETRTWFDVWKPPITAWQCKRCLWKPTSSPTKAVSGVFFFFILSKYKLTPCEMVLNQNQVSSKHLKMRLARRYTSQVFLYLRHIHFKVRLLTESRMTARLLKSRRLDWRKESLLMMEYAGLEFTRKMVLCLFNWRVPSAIQSLV